MLTKEEIEECGWVMVKDYTYIEEGYVFQIPKDDNDFWGMEWDPDTGKMIIEIWAMNTTTTYNPNTQLDCKIKDKEELIQEMKWIDIKL